MKKLLSISRLFLFIGMFLFVVSNCSVPQIENDDYKYGHYEGVADANKITMDLIFYKDSVWGTYCYDDKDGYPINIVGSKKKDRYLVVEHKVYDDESDTIIGTINFFIDKDSVLKGVRYNADKSQKTNIIAYENYSNSANLKCYSIHRKRHVNDDKNLLYVMVDYVLWLPVNVPNKNIITKIKKSLMKNMFKKESDDYNYVVYNYLDSIFYDSYASETKFFLNTTYEDILKDFYIDSTSYIEDYIESRDGESYIVFNDNSYLIIGYQRVWDERTMPHPIYFNKYFCYDLTDGRQLGYDDIFNNKKAIKQKIVEKLKKRYGNNIKSFSLKSENIFSLESFYFDKNGLVFEYIPYKIAPYSEGIIRLRFSYKEISPYIRKSFAKRMQIKNV